MSDNDAIERIRQALAMSDAGYDARPALRDVEKLLQLYNATLSAPVGEPVAHRWRYRTSNIWNYGGGDPTTTTMCAPEYVIELFYTHPPAPAVDIELFFEYINYRGERSSRCARPISFRFGTSEWHQKPQWLMLAVDLARNEEREFAMEDMTNVVGAGVHVTHLLFKGSSI